MLFKLIPEYNNYICLVDGTIFSLNKKRIIKPSVTYSNRLRIQLMKNGNRKKYFIHRLVAFCYLENPHPDKYDQINHKDGNTKNNHPSNLEWCDSFINNKHAYDVLNKTPSNLKLNKDDIMQIKKLLQKNKTLVFIANKFKVDPKTIYNIKNKKLFYYESLIS